MLALLQPGMASQGNTGAAEQSSRPPAVGGIVCLGGGGGCRGRHGLDLSAYTRVGGGVPVVPGPRCPRRLRRDRGCRLRSWDYQRPACRAVLPDIHTRMSEHYTSGRRPSSTRRRRHQTRWRSPVTRCRSPITQCVGSYSAIPDGGRFGGGNIGPTDLLSAGILWGRRRTT